MCCGITFVAQVLYKGIRCAARTVYVTDADPNGRTSWFTCKAPEGELVQCGEPRLEFPDEHERAARSSKPTGDSAGVKFAFVAEEGEDDAAIQPSKLKTFRKTSSIRYATAKKDLPSLL